MLFGGHALSFLFTRWSVSFRSRGEARHVSFNRQILGEPSLLLKDLLTILLQVTNIDTAEKIKVIPHLHRGKGEIVNLERTEVRSIPYERRASVQSDRLNSSMIASTASRIFAPHLLLLPTRQVPLLGRHSLILPDRLPLRCRSSFVHFPALARTRDRRED